MSLYWTLLCYCLLGWMAITMEFTVAEDGPGDGDDLNKRVDELKTAIKLAVASLKVISTQASDLHEKAKDGMAKQFLSFLDELSEKYFDKLPALQYYLKHKDCLTPEQTKNLIDVFNNGILHSGKSCVYKKAASDILDQIQSMVKNITVVVSSHDMLKARENECLEKGSPEDILYCLSAILYQERSLAVQVQAYFSIWKLALANYLKDDSDLGKTCYNEIPASDKAKYEEILNKYCSPPKKTK